MLVPRTRVRDRRQDRRAVCQRRVTFHQPQRQDAHRRRAVLERLPCLPGFKLLQLGERRGPLDQAVLQMHFGVAVRRITKLLANEGVGLSKASEIRAVQDSRGLGRAEFADLTSEPELKPGGTDRDSLDPVDHEGADDQDGTNDT